MSKLEFRCLSNLSDHELAPIAKSIIELDSEYYTAINDDSSFVSQVVVDIIKLKSTDCSQGEALFLDDNLVGYISFFPLSERQLRGLSSFKLISDKLRDEGMGDMSDFLIKAKNFQRGIEPITELKNGFYLNKIAVLPGYKGYGLTLFNRYLNCSKELKLSPVFHVRKDNIHAIRFYEQLGFTVNNSDYTYNVVSR